MGRAFASFVFGVGMTLAATFAGSLGLSVTEQRIGFVLGVVLILLAVVLFALSRRQSPTAPVVPTGKTGYWGRPGSTANLSDAEFSDSLDTQVFNEGDADLRRARFGRRGKQRS